MQINNGLVKIRRIKKRWVVSSVLAAVLHSIAISAVLAVILAFFVEVPPYMLAVMFVSCFAAEVLYKRYWTISDHHVARILNQRYPQLEESAQLLLRDHGSLNYLEKLQARKVEESLAQLLPPAGIYKSLQSAGIALVAGLLISLGISKIPTAAPKGTPEASTALRAAVKNPLPQIRSISISVNPPAYTGRKARKQEDLMLRVEEGANVTWMIETDLPVARLNMLLNNQESLSFTALNTNKTKWFLKRKLQENGFYQLKVSEKLSDLYRIEIIKDKRPEIKINTPQPYTVIDFGEPQEVKLSISLTDDYELVSASLQVTLASGKGESVSFKELNLPFKDFRVNEKAQQLRQVLQLSGLGMKPGDELYFSISAKDNHRQEARSDIYMVTIADTAQLMSMEGLSSGVNLMPEYFRSQRQIIIDTEKLLKDRETLSVEEFKSRSNDLGMDQKLLRLRYGKFLGEESESDIGEAEHEHEEPVRFGDPESMIDAVSHKHDNSEDATFYEPEQKAQLKAVLTEMWKAELQLRTFKPQAALPFEYKALRLLKDLQQKSRAYVGKTAIKTTPLKLEKRLTGELTEINAPVNVRTGQGSDPLFAVKTALSILDKRKKERFTSEEVRTLQEAGMMLTELATRRPAVYLPGMRALQQILNNSANKREITVVQAALYQLLKEVPRVPAGRSTRARGTLSEGYFNKLNTKRN